MSLYHSEESCVYCKAKLFSDDDVVYCPVCGAPHHRECYNALGHCALEHLHGTEEEYSKEKEIERIEKEKKEKAETEGWLNLDDEPSDNSEFDEEKYYKPSPDTVRCKMCGEIYEAKRGSCPKCNAPNFVRINGIRFDFLGGVPADEEVDDGITADDAKNFVLVNTQRYIPKFANFRKGKKASWNWLAFLFPSEWMFSRKMYVGGVITGLLQLIATIISIPVQKEMVSLGVYNNVTSIIEVWKNTYSVIPDINKIFIIFAAISSVIFLSVGILSGIFGDYWYKKYAMSQIKKIRKESSDIEMDNRKKGGVNVFGFLLAYLVLSYLPEIIKPFIF